MIIVHWFQEAIASRSGDHGLRQSDSAGFDVDGEHDAAWVRARAHVAAIRSGIDQRFFPECNLLIRAGERDAIGVPDHMHLVQVPLVLGRGVRIWDGLEALEDAYDVEAVTSPSGVAHLTFTRKR